MSGRGRRSVVLVLSLGIAFFPATADVAVAIPTVAGPDELGAAARPATMKYVALGDSFSSGEGAPYVDPARRAEFPPGTDPDRIENDLGWLGDTGTDVSKLGGGERRIADIADTSSFGGNNCHRSSHAYPARVWGELEQQDKGWGVAFMACSGALVEHVGTGFRGEPPQRTAFAGGPADLVTLGFGGNDVGFGDIVQCIIREGATDRIAAERAPRLPHLNPVGTFVAAVDGCRADLEPTLPAKLDALRRDLDALYTDITAPGNGLLAPGARVMAIGYPRLFRDVPPDSCELGARGAVSRDHMLWLNGIADRLNATIRAAAYARGIGFVDTSDIISAPEPEGTRHDFCVENGRDRWVNHFIPTDLRRSMHPKFAYHEKVTERVLDCRRDFRTCSPTPQQDSPGDLTVTDRWTGLRAGPLERSSPGMTAPLFAAFDLKECAAADRGPGLGTRIESVATGDLTGDGWNEAVVALACTPSTSAWPEHVVVLDGNAGPATPTQLGVELTDGVLVGTATRPRTTLHDLTATVQAGSVRLAGGARSDRSVSSDPPDHRYAQSFTWRQGRWSVGPVDFARTAGR